MGRIKAVTVLTAQGVNTYRKGSIIGGEFKINKIIKEERIINGDPYDHFCIYDTGGMLRVTINCLAPCEVEYFE
jgi:hypothetical protein